MIFLCQLRLYDVKWNIVFRDMIYFTLEWEHMTAFVIN